MTTTDKIMALADEYGNAQADCVIRIGSDFGYEWKKARKALRAEIEKLVRERDEAIAKAALSEGWVLVPVEPTPEMLKAAVVYANGNAVYKNVAAEALRIEESIYGEVYAAMLAAAQKGGA